VAASVASSNAPNGETEKLVSGFFFLQVSRQAWFLELMLIFSEILDDQ
jgi:hypothetical protein